MFDRTDILEDMKILDLSRIFTGPYCSQILGDMGAEIIKVEPPGGDDTRKWGPPFVGEDEISTYFAALNRNKRSVELDLNIVEDMKIFTQLVKWSDVVIENFRPGVTEKLGINFDAVKKLNQSIIYLTITGFGSKGPYANYSAYDIIAQSESGLMSTTGTIEGEITKVGVPVGDIAAAMYGAIGILATYQNPKNNKPVHIETNLLSSLTSWLTYQSLNSYYNQENVSPMGTGHPNIVPYQSFRCQKDEWITIAIGNNKLWKKFCQIIEKEDWINDDKFKTNKLRVEYRDILCAKLVEIFLSKPCEEWLSQFRDHGIPAGNVNGPLDVISHPQIEYLDQVIEIEIDDTSLPLFLTPLFFSNQKSKPIIKPPNQNQHRIDITRLLNLLKNDNN